MYSVGDDECAGSGGKSRLQHALSYAQLGQETYDIKPTESRRKEQ